MTNSIEKLLWFEKRAMKRGNLGTDAQWGKGNLFSTNIFSYVTRPGKVVFISSLDTRWGHRKLERSCKSLSKRTKHCTMAATKKPRWVFRVLAPTPVQAPCLSPALLPRGILSFLHGSTAGLAGEETQVKPRAKGATQFPLPTRMKARAPQ